MRRVLALVLLFVACGPAGTVAPSAATVDDLVGWWFNSDPMEGERVFGMVAPPDGPWSVPVDFSYRDRPISTLFNVQPRIRSTFEVKDGAILETVIDSVDFDPGKQFSTKIVSLVKGRSLSLESKTAVGGVRAYTWHERCPLTRKSGWSSVPVLNYPSYFATASTLAFDSKGRLHSFTGMAGEQNGAFPARPTYSVLDRGCEAIWFTASNARAAQVIVDGNDVVHLFWTESAIYSDQPDGTLMHKFRHTDSEQWTTETLSTLQTPLKFKAATRGQRTVLVIQRAGSFELLEFRDGSFTTTAVTMSQMLTGSLDAASVDPSGRVWLSVGGRLLRETSPAVFEVLPPLMAPRRLSGDFYVDGAGRAHHFVSRGPDGIEHGILENDVWRFLPAPNGEGFVPVEGPPWKYFNVTTHPFPFLTLATQTDTGINSWEFVSNSPYNPNTSTVRGVAVARDGTVAVSPTGEYVSLKRPIAPWGQVPNLPVTINITGSGAGRIWSDDGRIDCSATCTLQLPLLSRHRVHLEPAPGNSLLKVSGEPDAFPTQFAWLNIADDASQFRDNPDNTFTFEFGRSVTPVVIPLGPPTGSLGSLSAWDARGTSVALSSATTGGKVYFRDAEYSAPDAGAGEVLLLAEGASVPVTRRLPAPPSSLGVLTAGGARAVFFANRALTFEGTTLGASTAPVIAHVTWDSSLAQTDVQTLITLPANSTFLGSALDPVGNAAVLVQNATTGFPTLGTNVKTALVWRSSSGLVAVVPFEANLTLTSPRLALNGSTLLISSGSRFWVFADGVLAGSRTVTGASVSFGAPTSTGVQALVDATSGGVDVGGGSLNPMPGDQFLVRWGFDGAHQATTPQQPPITRVVAAGTEARGLLVLNQVDAAGPYLWLAAQNRGDSLVKTPTQVRALSAQLDGDGMWVLVQQQASTVDYGSASVAGAARVVLVKAVLPP